MSGSESSFLLPWSSRSEGKGRWVRAVHEGTPCSGSRSVTAPSAKISYHVPRTVVEGEGRWGVRRGRGTYIARDSG